MNAGLDTARSLFGHWVWTVPVAVWALGLDSAGRSLGTLEHRLSKKASLVQCVRPFLDSLGSLHSKKGPARTRVRVRGYTRVSYENERPNCPKWTNGR
jgi:hypothetical protein